MHTTLGVVLRPVVASARERERVALAHSTIDAPSRGMLAELSVIPLGKGTSLSDELAEILKLIDASGLAYQLTPSGTCIEGDWDAVMRVARQCHDHARSVSAHVITTLTIEDEQGASDKITANVTALEERLGRKLKRSGATAA
jgi:uncharacterized protein (TIGR00106 family)